MQAEADCFLWLCKIDFYHYFLRVFYAFKLLRQR